MMVRKNEVRKTVRAVLASVAAGELAPRQGAALLGAIGTLARVTELARLRRHGMEVYRMSDFVELCL